MTYIYRIAISEQTAAQLDNFYHLNGWSKSRNEATIMDQATAESIISLLRVNDWLNLYEYGIMRAA